MPRVKIDYVVSFSSESPESPASNLLASEAGHGRWLCARGESSCSVLLQLPRAIQISSVTIGAHLAALIEVLVGKSETPNDPFQVLVASSVFLSPIDSRRATEGDSAADRVRSFNTDQLAAEVRSKRWDRVRVVCSQPYNKHCKYGLSFIHIFSPESDTAEKNTRTSDSSLRNMSALAKPALKLPLDISPQDSDDDEFKPGALFAKHRAASQAQERSSSQSQESGSNTDAQIRKATSQAIKNVFGSSTKIVRTSISKPKGTVTPNDEAKSDRTRESLMYEDEDAGPHDKIDRLVSAHKDQQAKNSAIEKQKQSKEKASKEKLQFENSKQKRDRSREESSHNRTPKDKQRDRDLDDSGRTDDKTKTSYTSHKDKDRTESKSKSPQWSKRDRSWSSKLDSDDRDSKKQKVPSKQDTDNTLYASPVSDKPHELLRGVVFVMSGYENPRRAAARDAALAMGAAFQRDWGPSCTHLICAFPNTPKLRTVRSSPNGNNAIVVTAEWIERQAARQRRLPWQWFATEPKLRVKRARAASGEDPPGTSIQSPKMRRTVDDPDSEHGPSTSADVGQVKGEEDKKKMDKEASPESDCDTDDEIERVMRKNAQKRERVASEEESQRKKKKTDADLTNLSQGSDVNFVRDERIKAEITVSDSDDNSTDKEEDAEDTQDLSSIKELPTFFDGCTFAVHAANKPILDEKLLRRYVRTYGGEIVEAYYDDEDLEVDYVLCLSSNTEGIRHKGRRVRGDWVWRCHERRKLCSPGEFTL